MTVPPPPNCVLLSEAALPLSFSRRVTPRTHIDTHKSHAPGHANSTGRRQGPQGQLASCRAYSLSLSPSPSSRISAEAIPKPISPAASMDKAGSVAALSACARCLCACLLVIACPVARAASSDGSIRKWPSPALIEVSAWLWSARTQAAASAAKDAWHA